MPTTAELESLVWQRLAQVPAGRVTTFGAIAASLGAPSAARWVGTVIGRRLPPANCPVHRLVRADGSLAGADANDVAGRQEILEREAVACAGQRIDLVRYGWHDFHGPRPLAPLLAWQAQAQAGVELIPWRCLPRWVAGLDASYALKARGRNSSADEAGVAAFVLYDLHREQVVWTTTVTRVVDFPYLPGLLGWRELPLLAAAIEAARQADRLAELHLVDGSGILHPRGCGLATHLGLVAGVPTVGVAKKLLCGELGRFRPAGWQSVTVGDELRGAAWHVGSGHRKIYVSPGTGIDVAAAARVVGLTLAAGSLPRPIAEADRLSRGEARRLRNGPAHDPADTPGKSRRGHPK